MNAIQYAHLINNPTAINDLHTAVLDKITAQFPFFQSAQAMQLKNLYVQNSLQYNQALKKTAAFTADRSILFELIASDNFMSIQKMIVDEKETKIKTIDTNRTEDIIEKKVTETISDNKNKTFDIDNTIPYQAEKLEKSIRDLITIDEVEIYNEIEFIRKPTSIELPPSQLENRLEIGKPLSFTADEQHSFQEWLQLASFKPVDRVSIVTQNIAEITAIEETKQKKNDIIDRFIASNPKISSVKNYVQPIGSSIENEDNSSIMTETLAKVYLEQKKYQKAIQAYEILILKYPDKFSFFANRISDIKSLQQNNH